METEGLSDNYEKKQSPGDSTDNEGCIRGAALSKGLLRFQFFLTNSANFNLV